MLVLTGNPPMPDHWRAPFNEAALSSFLVVADTMVRQGRTKALQEFGVTAKPLVPSVAKVFDCVAIAVFLRLRFS